MLSQLLFELTLLKANALFAFWMVMGLFAVHFVNVLLGYRLNILGIYPRHIWGLIGIPCSSFLHGNFNHLFFNSIPLFVLSDFMLLNGLELFIRVTAWIILLSGIGTWLFGRSALHIGASSVIMGYWGYLLANSISHPGIMMIIPAFVCIYYFGTLLISIFPLHERVSWEGHIFGLLAGLVTAHWYPFTGYYLRFGG